MKEERLTRREHEAFKRAELDIRAADMGVRIAALNRHRLEMRTYLGLKAEQQDWHGVADAAMDLRDIDAEIIGLEFAIGILRHEEFPK